MNNETPPVEEAAPTGPGPHPHGPLYYLVRNLSRMVWKYPAGRAGILGTPVVLALALYFGRSMVNPHLVAVRRQSPAIALVFLSLTLVGIAHSWMLRWPRLRWGLTGAVLLTWIGIAAYPGRFFHDLSLYGCWINMDRTELHRLPLTHDERIYPLSMISRIVEDRVTQSHFTVSPFEMQVLEGELHWVAQKTPAGKVNTMTLQDVTGLVQVAASSVEVEILHHQVDFPYGRDQALVKDLGHYILPHRLGLLDLFDKEIDHDDLSFQRDEQGNWVMVMAVIDWDGIFPFCVPRFGGVFVCPQRGKGDIRWVKPDEIETLPYLRGQNLVPEMISQFHAESWKFHQGFFAWLRNEGVTKITSIPEDTAQQPFAVNFRDVNHHDGVFQFFALEPDGRSAGLSKMVLVDPRGYKASPPVYVYDFEARGEELVGPARIAETIKASDIHVDWRQAKGGTFVIAESRPYIQEVNGKRSFQWFNSVVTRDQGSGQPRVVLADPKTLAVNWLEPQQVKQLLEH